MIDSARLESFAGGCHCGRVRFEVSAAHDAVLLDCNCSICSKFGYLHLIVPRKQFKLLQGQSVITNYTFGSAVAQHYFCAVCGVKSFYVPRSHPDCISVNARCIDCIDLASMTIQAFNGLEWEKGRAALAD